MPDVLDALADLAAHPPRPAPPADEIRDRAAVRRRRRHRRRTATGALAVVVAVAAGTTALVRRDDGRVPVATDDRPTTTAVDDAGDALSRTPAGDLVLDRPLGLVLEPDADLPEAAEVEVSLLDDPGGEVLVTQCAAEIVEAPATTRSEAAGTFCGNLEYRRTPSRRAGAGEPPRDPQLTIGVGRRLVVGDQLIDCAVAPGRCVVAVRPSEAVSGADDRFAPLHFAPGDPLPAPSLSVGPGGTFVDGGTAGVVGRGFQPGQQVRLRQCLDDVTDGPQRRCDGEARTREATVGADGSFTVDTAVYRDIGVGNYTDALTVTWTPCEPCLLEAVGGGVGAVSTPIAVAPTDTPIHPTIRIVPDGPHVPGQVVRVEGSGFARAHDGAGPRIDLMFCATEGEVGQCVYPGNPMAPIVPPASADGAFVVEALALPAAGTSVPGVDCAARPGACALVWRDSSEGAAYGQMVPLDLSG